jgi:hypothetical protein
LTHSHANRAHQAMAASKAINQPWSVLLRMWNRPKPPTRNMATRLKSCTTLPLRRREAANDPAYGADEAVNGEADCKGDGETLCQRFGELVTPVAGNEPVH